MQSTDAKTLGMKCVLTTPDYTLYVCILAFETLCMNAHVFVPYINIMLCSLNGLSMPKPSHTHVRAHTLTHTHIHTLSPVFTHQHKCIHNTNSCDLKQCVSCMHYKMICFSKTEFNDYGKKAKRSMVV